MCANEKLNMCTSERKPKGLFINTAKANCSIYESGIMIYKSMLLSKRYNLEYLEIDANHRDVPNNYDFYAFNYHYSTMGWLNTKSISSLSGMKITFVLEVLPNNPFVLCSERNFDAYCVLDPTINVTDKRVYAFTRPLEVVEKKITFREPEIPIIGCFGFATPGKGFELVVDAVNKEFDEAIVRINIPSATYADDACWNLHKRNYAEYLGELCQKVAKSGVEVVVTHEYLTKEELIAWCSRNTLNCFLYKRNQPGLAATTDQAISSGRPLAISTNETFRHIHSYIKPYPFQSLKDSIASSQAQVLKMQRDWSSDIFVAKFEAVLDDYALFSTAKSAQSELRVISLRKKQFDSLKISIKKLLPPKYKETLKCLLGPLTKSKHISVKRAVSAGTMGPSRETILIVSHKKVQCGIYQYGLNIFEALKRSTRFSFHYKECSSQKELHEAVLEAKPAAIIYNYYPLTMPWLRKEITRRYNMPQLGIMHEVTQEEADKATDEMFDYHLCPDPTLRNNNPIVIKTKRLIPTYVNVKPAPDVLTVGSFGFGFSDKGFERLVHIVQNEFDRAKILLHMPFNDVVDKHGMVHARATAWRCRQLITKPGIQLRINHKFMAKQQLLDFLASNTLNAFFYDTHKMRAISSTIEHALAVQRPIAITKCGMFRHVYDASPSICIEDSTLTQIINNGIAPLVPFYNEWSEENFIADYERIIKMVLAKSRIHMVALA